MDLIKVPIFISLWSLCSAFLNNLARAFWYLVLQHGGVKSNLKVWKPVIWICIKSAASFCFIKTDFSFISWLKTSNSTFFCYFTSFFILDLGCLDTPERTLIKSIFLCDWLPPSCIKVFYFIDNSIQPPSFYVGAFVG